MKVIALNGSPRKGGNTAMLLGRVLEEIKKEGIETELLEFAGKKIHGCVACYKCSKNLDKKCAIDNDDFNKIYEKMLASDGIIIGSPVYVTDVTAEIKGLIDRACIVTRANGQLLRRRVGAAVIAVRRAGATHAYDSINHFFGITEMIVPGSNYWNLGIGRDPGEVMNDKEGLETMRVLGANIAWLLKKITQ